MPARIIHPYQHYHPYNTTTATAPLSQTKSRPSPKPSPRPRSQPTSKSKPKPSSRCFDWLLLPTTSNTHIAKNRSSFISYRRAPCKIANQRVLGVGTVQLRVQRAPDDPRTNTLVLHDVLHMPNARCNGISVAKYTGESEDGSGSEDGSEVMSEGSSAGERCVVGVEGDERSRNGRWFQVRSEREQGEGLWFARGGQQRQRKREGEEVDMGVDGLRVVLAGDGEREMNSEEGLDGGEGGDGRRRMFGVVASKEELEMLNERVRNRSWV